MNKQDLIEQIASDADISKAAAARALGSYLGSVQRALKAGKKVSIVGFGTFSTVKRKAREGRNPATGAAIKIAAKRVAKFTPGVGLSDAVR